MNGKVKLVLAVLLAVSLCLSGYFGYQAYSNSTRNATWTRTFSFWWAPEQQNITSGKGVLWMNFTFTRIGENLSITVRVNDDEDNLLGNQYGGGDLILIFFEEPKEIYTTPHLLTSTNGTLPAYVKLAPTFSVTSPMRLPDPSPWHKCTFSNETGYTYIINIPLKDIGNSGNIIAIFGDRDVLEPSAYGKRFEGGMYVMVQFNYLG